MYPELQNLIECQKTVYGGEANEKVLLSYESLINLHLVKRDYAEALRDVLKIISLHKQMHGNDVKDSTLAGYLIKLGFINHLLKRYDDAIRTLKDSESMLKKLPQTDPNVKAYTKELNDLRVAVLKEKMDYDKQFKKPLLARIRPDTPMKMAIWASILFGVTGMVAYTLLKRRH